MNWTGIVFVIGMLLAIAYLGMREQRKHNRTSAREQQRAYLEQADREYRAVWGEDEA